MARKRGERLRMAPIAQKFDGTGVAYIQCSEGAYTALKLSNIPAPAEWGHMVNGVRRIYASGREMGASATFYRVIWPELANGPGSKFRTSSFAMSSNHLAETLFVFAEFLRDQGVKFIALANKHGSAFQDVALGGTQLAYASGYFPHSPACHVDFVGTYSPEFCRTPWGVVHASSLDS